METTKTAAEAGVSLNMRVSPNRHTVKGLMMGGLILLMMIPTLFIMELVHEREKRQREVTEEVSQKWSSSQTLSGPYIFLPYRYFEKAADGRVTETVRHIWLLPEQLSVRGQIDHEFRKRSIYQVLLYRAGLHASGSFQATLPRDIDSGLVKWQDARICLGLSDFKGIEERMVINFRGVDYELSPGLPAADVDENGLSAPVQLTPAEMGRTWTFDMKFKLKGSRKLHFKPMGGNSEFELVSSWPSPSFDGNSLPGDKQVSDSGFRASWKFNKANLPYSTTLRDFKIDESSIAFGVTLLQPADNYAKTERSVKYAILIIGLTFSLFFIIEILQKNPVHPVQYLLIGLALVIFYTLLLSISEFLAFDTAYAISASATVLLITAYAWSHFRKLGSALLFGGVLGFLYGFIFILIRLEDTALLVGSIALFIVLALVMYASRKVKWYASSPQVPESFNA